MRVGIEALTRELISQHDWIFPVVNGKRIGHEMDVASIYLSHGIHFQQARCADILEVEIEVNTVESRDKLREKILSLLDQPLIEPWHQNIEHK